MRHPGVFALLLAVGTFGVRNSEASNPIPPTSKLLPLVAVRTLDTFGVSGSDASLVGDAVASRLLASKTCNVMERSQMDQILREQAFQQSGACDNSGCAVEIGKVLSVDRMLVGTIGRIGDAWALNLRLVRVETGEVLMTYNKIYTAWRQRDLWSNVPDLGVVRILDDLSSSRSWTFGTPVEHPNPDRWDGAWSIVKVGATYRLYHFLGSSQE